MAAWSFTALPQKVAALLARHGLAAFQNAKPLTF
jgi:hypothetical protein